MGCRETTPTDSISGKSRTLEKKDQQTPEPRPPTQRSPRQLTASVYSLLVCRSASSFATGEPPNKTVCQTPGRVAVALSDAVSIMGGTGGGVLPGT